MDSLIWYHRHVSSLNDILDDDGIIVKQLVPNKKRGKDTHLFAAMNSQEEFVGLILKSKPAERTFYELLVADKPQKMFADLDSGIFSSASPEELLEKKINIAKEFEELLTAVFVAVFTKKGFKQQKCKWTICTGNKLSLHFCYNYVFKNHAEQRYFWEYVILVLKYEKSSGRYDNLFDVVTKKPGQIEPIIDLSVYSRNRALRTIYSHKGKNERVFLPYDIHTGLLLEEEKINLLDYFAYSPIEKHREIIVYPLYDNAKEFNYSKIIEKIHDYVPDITNPQVLHEYNPVTISFDNKYTVRKCIFGIQHDSNRSHVIITQKGIMFKCKSENCKDKKKYLWYFNNKHVIPSVQAKMKHTGKIKQYHFLQSNNFVSRKVTKEYVDVWSKEAMIVIRGIRDGVMKRVKTINRFGYDYEWEFNTNYRQDLCIACNISVGETVYHTLDKYIAYLMRQCHLNRYDKLYFSPDRDKYVKGGFNTYTGFLIEPYIEPSVVYPDFTESTHYTHLRDIMCNGDEIVIDWFFDWIAMLFQDPHLLPLTVPCFISHQGTGKGLLVELLENIIGNKYVLIANDTSAVFSNFNAERKDKILICLDEISTKGAAWVNKNMLKGMITDKTVRIEEKYKDAKHYDSFAHYIITTNNEGALYIEQSDRRFCFIQCNNKYANNQEYAKRLVKELNDVNFLKSMYCYFKERKYDMSRVRTVPLTNLKIDQMALSLPNAIKFLMDIFEHCEDDIKNYITDDILLIKAVTLHKMYNEWCMLNNVPLACRVSKTTFLTSVKSLKITNGMVYNTITKKSFYGIKISLDDLEANIQSYTKNKEYKIIRE